MRRVVRRPRVESSAAPAPEAGYWEARVARNGRGGSLAPVANALRAEAGSTGKGDAAPMVLAYNIVPEWGGGADLRAIATDVSNAVTVTDHAKKTDRGIRVVQAFDGKDVRLAEKTGTLTASMDSSRTSNKRVGMVTAYEVDKERGVPNSQGVKVREIEVAGTITADGDPAEKNDRGTRILPERVGLVRRLTPTECERLQGFPDGWTVL